MTQRLVVALLVLAAAGGVAAMLRSRRREPPLSGAGQVPDRVDRADFAHPERPWLLVVFTSRRCVSCADALAAARDAAAGRDDVAVVQVEHTTDPALHERYRIDAVPALLVCDARGVTRASFLGAVGAERVRAALEDADDDGVSRRSTG